MKGILPKEKGVFYKNAKIRSAGRWMVREQLVRINKGSFHTG